MTQRAKLFESDGEQAVLLPVGFWFEGQEEVRIYREGERVVLEPVRQQRREWSPEFLEIAGGCRGFYLPGGAIPCRTRQVTLNESPAKHEGLDREIALGEFRV